jgi:hypothetical protein
VGSAVGQLGTLLVRAVWIIRPGLDGRCHEGGGELLRVTPVLGSQERRLE